MRPVGMQEIARMFGVPVQTVYTWDQRGLLPDPVPVITVGGRRVWRAIDIERWARRTGRTIAADPYQKGA